MPARPGRSTTATSPVLDCEVCDGLNERQTNGRPGPFRLRGRVRQPVADRIGRLATAWRDRRRQRGDGLRACVEQATAEHRQDDSNGATDSRRVGAAAVVLDWHDIRAAVAGRLPSGAVDRAVPCVRRPSSGTPEVEETWGGDPHFSEGIVVHRRWRHTRTGRRRQRRRPARIAMPCSPASRSTIEHLGRRSRSVSPVQAGVGVTRLMTAGGAATSRIRPAFTPTVGGVTGTSPRYGNRSRRRTSRRSRR